jgi:DNA-binding CsgD family transcriptional regulator
MVAIVGRTPELALLRAAVGRGALGQSRVVILEGEAGIGKTTLLDVVGHLAQGEGITVARGAATELESDRPFGALISALDLTSRSKDPRCRAIAKIVSGATLAPDSLGASIPEHRYRGVDAIHGLVDEWCSERPLVLLLDDIHWADESTLLTIRRLARSLGMPLLVVVTTRPPRTGDLVTEMFDTIVAAGGAHVRLGPLGRRDVRELLAELVGGPPGPRLIGLAEGAGGNPLFVSELVEVLRQDGSLRSGEEGVEVADGAGTSDLARRLRARAARLGPAASALVRVGAVLGGSFTLDEAARTGGWALADLLEPLDELLGAGLLVDADGAIMFRHDLLRRAIEDELPPTARRALHAAAGHALISTGASPARIARHLALGAERDTSEAVAWLHRAARDVAPRAPAAALGLLDTALALVTPDDPARVDLLADRVEALGWSGRNAEAELLAKELLGSLDDQDTRLALRRQLSLALFLGNRPSEAIEQCEISAAECVGDDGARATALAEAGLACIAAVQLARAEQFVEASLELGNSSAMAVSLALSVRSRLLAFQGQADASLTEAERAYDVAADSGAHGEVHRRQPGFFVVMSLLDLERHHDLDVVLHRERTQAEERGTVWALPLHHAAAANQHLMLARLEDAAAEATTGLTVAEDSGALLAVPWLHAVLAIVALHRGDVPAATMHVRLGDDSMASTTPLLGSDLHALAQARLAEARRDPPAAAGIAVGAFDFFTAIGVVAAHRNLGLDALRLAHVVGDDEAVDRVAAGLAGLAAQGSVPTDRATARFAAALQKHDLDTMAAVASDDSGGVQPLRRAVMSEMVAQLLWANGLREEAGAALSAARRVFDASGATGDLRRNGDLFAALGLRHGPSTNQPTSGWESLTASEQRVAAMVGTGVRNSVIAEQLGVSRRTVETHLRHIYAKLHLTSRVDLALTATRHAV